MKYVMIVGDGMADMPLPVLNDMSPLEAGDFPAFDKIAGGKMGRARTCPTDMAPGSDVAFLSLFGNQPKSVFTGRSPLEAAGSGIELKAGEMSYRVNIISVSGQWEDAIITSHNGDGINGDAAYAMMCRMINDADCARLLKKMSMTIHPTHTFRHVAVVNDESLPDLAPPHDILGEHIKQHLPCGALGVLMRYAKAAMGAQYAIWPWGGGSATLLPNFFDKYHKRGCAISPVPLVRGIARLSGVSAPDLPGATGLIDTNYESKVSYALEWLNNGNDFALIHAEAPDELSHAGDLAGKLEAMRRIDARIAAPILKALPHIDRDFRVMLLPDHYTRLDTRTHDGTPVPFAILDSRNIADSAKFCERAVKNLPIIEGAELLDVLFS